MIYRDPPPGLHNLAQPCMTFLELFFCYFLNIVLDPSWADFGTNLPPNLAPKSTKNRSKRAPNSKPTCIIFSIPFLIDFGSLLGRILEGFGPQVEGQVDQKIYHIASRWQVGRNSKKYKKPMVFYSFLYSRPSNFEVKLQTKRPQSDPKSNKKLTNILTHFLIDFWANLAPFWEGFGLQVGAKLGPKATKTRCQN